VQVDSLDLEGVGHDLDAELAGPDLLLAEQPLGDQLDLVARSRLEPVGRGEAQDVVPLPAPDTPGARPQLRGRLGGCVPHALAPERTVEEHVEVPPPFAVEHDVDDGDRLLVGRAPSEPLEPAALDREQSTQHHDRRHQRGNQQVATVHDPPPVGETGADAPHTIFGLAQRSGKRESPGPRTPQGPSPVSSYHARSTVIRVTQAASTSPIRRSGPMKLWESVWAPKLTLM
jgi:hypothetical protein